MGERFERAIAPVSATPIVTLTGTLARSVLPLLVAILERTDKAVDLVTQAHVHRAPRTARPVRQASAARPVRRIGLERSATLVHRSMPRLPPGACSSTRHLESAARATAVPPTTT